MTVEARDAAGVGQVTFTGGTGEFAFSGLAAGTYEVTFTLAGFNVPPQTAEVAAGAAATVDVEMSSRSRSGWSSSGRARNRGRSRSRPSRST